MTRAFPVVLFVLVSTAHAHGPYVKIISEEKATSGTVIHVDGKTGWDMALTCGHGHTTGKPLKFYVHGGIGLGDGIVGPVDAEADLAIVYLKGSGCSPIAVGDASPSKGEQVTITGFGKNVFASKKTTVVDGFFELGGTEFIRIDASTRPGDSGGGLVYKGKLVGVHVKGLNRDKKNTVDGLEVPVWKINDFLVEKAGWGRR